MVRLLELYFAVRATPVSHGYWRFRCQTQTHHLTHVGRIFRIGSGYAVLVSHAPEHRPVPQYPTKISRRIFRSD